MRSLLRASKPLLVIALLLGFFLSRNAWETQVFHVQRDIASAATSFDKDKDLSTILASVSVIQDNLTRLDHLANTCPILVECSIFQASSAHKLIVLENQQIALFRDTMKILDEAKSLAVSDPSSAHIGDLKDRYQNNVVEYTTLIHQIDALEVEANLPASLDKALNAL